LTFIKGSERATRRRSVIALLAIGLAALLILAGYARKTKPFHAGKLKALQRAENHRL